MMALYRPFANGHRDSMNNSFLDLSHIYLESNGALKKDALSTFLASLPATIISSFESNDLRTLLLNWYGPRAQLKLIKSSYLTGNSGDPIIELSIKKEIYFFKMFNTPSNGLKEYLSYLYTTERNLPHWKHVPIIKMGKLRHLNGEERIYSISKKASGVRGIEHIFAFNNKNDHLTSLESFFATLGTALSHLHQESTSILSEQDLYHQVLPFFNNPLLQKTFSKDPISSQFYNEFQTSVKTFTKTSMLGYLKSGCMAPGNFSLFPGTGYIEFFDQGELLDYLKPDGYCYTFYGYDLTNIMSYLITASLLAPSFSKNSIVHLKKIFLNAYSPEKLPPFNQFYDLTDIWLRYHLFKILETLPYLENTGTYYITKFKTELLHYIQDPKAYLAKWFYD